MEPMSHTTHVTTAHEFWNVKAIAKNPSAQAFFALRVVLALKPVGEGQAMAQRELVMALESALEARRQRILISQSGVNWVKWTGLLLQAACTLVTIAMVHCDNRRAAAIALGLFATGIAVSLVLIASHDRPFTGQISVRPDVLRQVIPLEPAGR